MGRMHSRRLSMLSDRRLNAALNQMDMAKTMWSQVIRMGDKVLDCTAGNGMDSAFMARLCIGNGNGNSDIRGHIAGGTSSFSEQSSGHIYFIDIQQHAIGNTTQLLLSKGFQPHQFTGICGSHDVAIPAEITNQSLAVCAYNLGYLPGYLEEDAKRDNATPRRRLITQAATSVASISRALPLLRKGGLMTIISYRGHDGGEEEFEAVQEVLSHLDPSVWRVTSNTNFVVKQSPVLFTAYRRERTPRGNPVKAAYWRGSLLFLI